MGKTEKAIGRFAPSPTGPLHFGSLVAAMGSYLDVKKEGGTWLVRMEDVDTSRVVPGTAHGILRALERFGFEWEGPVMEQNARTGAYEEALSRLRDGGLAYPCGCSRKDVEILYSGTCRAGLPPGRTARSMRLRVTGEPIVWFDRLRGDFAERLDVTSGDFIVRRADGLFAYQLAVVVDDAAQGVTSVVRGADLLDSTARQVYLQKLLGYPAPAYLHLPVACNDAGQKLSKQTRATALNEEQPLPELLRAWRFLGQQFLETQSTGEFWRLAKKEWNPALLLQAETPAAESA